MAPTSGILYVTMQPKDSLPPERFHDWYNNEHGPGRLRLSFCHNGFRYRANDLEGKPGAPEKPEWMAIYDIEDMQELTKDTYTRLRAAPVQSQRERDTMKEIKVDRRFYDFISEEKGSDFRVLEDIDQIGQGNVLVAVSLSLHPGQDKEEELAKWYRDEHIPLLQKVPGWRRTRRFVTSSIEPKEEKEWLALHEYAPQNGLGGPEFLKATTTDWTKRMYETVVREKRRRTYDLYYTFGPASRDLASLNQKETTRAESTDGATKTFPAKEAGRSVIESFVTTKDGADLPYRLEGADDANAPLIVLSNSILVEWGIWDDFVDAFLKQRPGWRVLRYHTRGRSSKVGTQPVTVDLLGQDVIELLDALRVLTAAAVVGVSLGGATAQNVGLRFPNRVAAFVACDTNAVSPAGNPKAWGERIEVAEKEGARATGVPVVGEQLAEMTVRRWFVKESYDGGDLEQKITKVKSMVENNSLEGFKRSVQALYEYDMRAAAKQFKGKAAYVVGKGDGVLPKTMQEMAEQTGGGAPLKVVDGAGHLPMVERPQEVADFVAGFVQQ